MLIFTRRFSHLAWFWNWWFLDLGNGIFSGSGIQLSATRPSFVLSRNAPPHNGCWEPNHICGRSVAWWLKERLCSSRYGTAAANWPQPIYCFSSLNEKTWDTKLTLTVYYSFEIFLRFWLAKCTRIIHHNQQLLTKFGRILRWINRWRQKCSTVAGWCNVNREDLGTRFCCFGCEKKNDRTVGGTF